jgi:hypothetical protein
VNPGWSATATAAASSDGADGTDGTDDGRSARIPPTSMSFVPPLVGGVSLVGGGFS